MAAIGLDRILAQDGFSVRLDWALAGARALAPRVDLLVIVDVLSFTTAVDVAAARGARVYPFPHRDPSAAAFAQRKQAILAVDRQRASAEQPYSLSPASLEGIQAGTAIVLPSPNGSAISFLASELGRPILASCLRNADAIAIAARTAAETIGVIASGERWPDGSLRPAYEDLVGAGAVIDALGTTNLSPEAQAAVGAFRAARDHLPELLMTCASGRELVALGFPQDVQIAAELNVSRSVPVLDSGAFVASAYLDYRQGR